MLDKDLEMSSLIRQHAKILSRKDKRQILAQYIFDKNSKTFSLIQRYIKILFRKDKRRTLT